MADRRAAGPGTGTDRRLASFGAANLLLGLAERAIAMTLHISLSVVGIPGCPTAQGRVSGIGGGAACAVRCSRRFIPVRRAAQYLAGGSTAAGALPGCAAYAKKQYYALQEPEQQTLSDKEES